jgi:glycosyltransferase involved in cell wall biosynthesis
MLAIIIPYFKLTFFDATLQSLANQTDKRFKVFIGDDASPGNPADLLKNYKDQFEFVYHRFDSNLGGISLVKQWERCIALTIDEEWIMILGDDDVLGATVVASWYENNEMFNKKSNLVRFASRIIDEEMQNISDVYSHPIWESAPNSFFRKFKNLTRSSLSEYVFSKAAYLKYGFYDYPLAWYSDDRAWFDFSDNKPIFTINESIVMVRISGSSISGKTVNIHQKDLAALEFHKFIVKKKLKNYNKQERHLLLNKIESAIKKIRELYLSEWFLILFCYLKYFDAQSLKKVLKRCVKSMIRYEV